MSSVLTSEEPIGLSFELSLDSTAPLSAIELAAQCAADEAPALTEATRGRLRELLGGIL